MGWPEEAEELRRRLDEYRRIREATAWLQERLAARRDEMFWRGALRRPRRGTQPSPQARLF